MSTSRFTTAIQVFEAFPSLYTDMVAKPLEESPVAFATRTAESATPEDSLSFCAYMLDRRKATWWACQCVRRLGSPDTPEEDIALRTAEAWVRDPDEKLRLDALAIGMNGNHRLPAVWAALAAGGSGGTMNQGDHPGPPVPDMLSARAARAAVLIALARVPARERASRIPEMASAAIRLYQSP
jgi:hypothetical protein